MVYNVKVIIVTIVQNLYEYYHDHSNINGVKNICKYCIKRKRDENR